MSPLEKLIEAAGNIVGVARTFVSLIDELINVFGKEMEQLTKAECEIDSAIKVQLTHDIRECDRSLQVFRTTCSAVVDKWEQLKQELKAGIKRDQLLKRVQDLLSDARRINEPFAVLQEKLQSALITATNLAEKCKMSENEARESKSVTAFKMATRGVVLSSVLMAALSGGVGLALGGAAACLFVFKAYDRIKRLNELIDKLRSHLDHLESTVKQLNNKADELNQLETRLEIIRKMLEEAEIEIKRQLRDQEQVEARAQTACVPPLSR